MAFFGVEVKPAKPFTHSSDIAKGRLRISQATLAIGSATKKSWVQCNVGNKSPVLLCVLIPDTTESCHLDLEFDESEDVVFSIIGPRSVYLTGYYVNTGRLCNMNSDTESYGEDVGNTETEDSNYHSDEDKYEDSFIDDNEPEVSPPSPVSSGGVGTKKPEDNDPMDGNGNLKRLKKRYQVIESDDDSSSEDSEDGYLLSVFKNRRTGKAIFVGAGDDTNKPIVSTGGETGSPAREGSESNEVPEAVNLNNEPVRNADRVCNSLLSADGVFSEKEVEKKECNGSEDSDNRPKAKGTCQNIPVNDVKDQKQTVDNEMGASYEKPKNKKKKRTKELKVHGAESGSHKEVQAEHTEIASGNIQQDLVTNDKQDPITDMEIDDNPAKLHAESGPKSKKRRRETKGESTEGTHNQIGAIKGENFEPDTVKAVNMGKDVSATTVGDQILNKNKEIEVKPAVVAEGCLSEKKTKTNKKKKSKRQENEGQLNMFAPVHEKSETVEDKLLMEFEDKHFNAASEVRILSNGLTIEELAKGESDGKIAALGKRVKIYYTARLKEDGHVFDSNIGKSPYKFRLGNEEVIEGWNLGIDGMHVGDKRRLIIPPSLGYGNQSSRKNVPPDSWLVCDVELVEVRR